MINDKSRAGFFGASDSKFIMGNWNTTTFYDWWTIKAGLKENKFGNIYTLTGTHKEHQIADFWAELNKVKIVKDRQIIIKNLKLRINLDAETKTEIDEIKTYKITDKEWKPNKEYEWQVQVQMFGSKKHKGRLIAYGLLEEDYNNFYLPIDPNRLKEFEIVYDPEWIAKEYLPRLVYLAECLKTKKTPNKEDFERRKPNENCKYHKGLL